MIGTVNVDSTEHLVGSTLYCTCDTVLATKIVTCSDPNFTPIPGLTIHVLFSEDCGTSQMGASLNVNDTGMVFVASMRGSTASRVGLSDDDPFAWKAGSLVSFTYQLSGNTPFWVINKSSSVVKYTIDSSTHGLNIEYV